jgi:hypothetical protein
MRMQIRGCSPHGARTVVADAQARVFRVRKGDRHNLEFWGCVSGTTRAFRLGTEESDCSPSGCAVLQNVAMSGAVVAYETSSSWVLVSNGEVVENRWHVVVLDLRSGRVLHKVPTGVTYPPQKGFVGDGPTTAIVVKADGAVAWILDTVQQTDRYQVHVLDRTGERVLAVGSDIAPGSLALAGSTLFWLQGGRPFSAVLD